MKKVLFVVDFKSQEGLINDIKRMFFDKIEMVFSDEDSAFSTVLSQRGFEAVVFCNWQRGGATLRVVEDINRNFFGQTIVCNNDPFFRRALMAMNCSHECTPKELPEIINNFFV